MHSYTQSSSHSYTRTSARYIASKIVADLRRVQSYYGTPVDGVLESFQQELCELLAGGYVAEVEYGFRRQGKRVLCLRYRFRLDGTLADENAGGVPARVDISGASWFSCLMHSEAWWLLSGEERERIQSTLPFRRTAGAGPEDGDGYWDAERTYARDGAGAHRSVFRPYDRR